MRAAILALALVAAALSATLASAQQAGTVSNMPFASTPLGGNELLYIIQGGISKKTNLLTALGQTAYVAIGNGADKATSPAVRSGHLLNMVDDFVGGYGDTLDGYTDGIIAAGTNSLCSASANFSALTDIGKVFVYDGVGAAGAPLVTTITAVPSAHCVTLANSATTAGPFSQVTLTNVPLSQTITSNYAPGAFLFPVGATGTPGTFQIVYTEAYAATVASPGTGGTNGTNCFVTGTTGTQLGGNVLSVHVTVSGGGIATDGVNPAIQGIATAGWYSTNPTNPAQEPVTGCNLTGAKLNLSMGPRVVVLTSSGQYLTTPANPYPVTSSGAGTGAVLSSQYATTKFWYGHDDTAAFVKAFTAMDSLALTGLRSCIYMPARIYTARVAALPVMRQNLCMFGDGPEHTTVRLIPNTAGDFISCSFCSLTAISGAFPNNGSSGSALNNYAGALIHDFSIIGDRSSTANQNAVMFYDTTTQALLYNMEYDYIRGRAIGTGKLLNTPNATFRESRVLSSRYLYDGDGAAFPVIDIASTGPNADGINTNSFVTNRIFAPFGTAMRFCNDTLNNNGRIINVIDTTIEGEQKGFVPADLMMIGDPACVGQIVEMDITGLNLVSVYAGQAGIHLNAASSAVAPDSINISGAGSAGGSSYGTIVQIDQGTNINLNLNSLKGHSYGLGVGPQVTVGPVYAPYAYKTASANIDSAAIPAVLDPIGRPLFGSGTGSSTVLAQTGVITSHTGDTNETTLGTCTVPANSMGANGRIEVYTNWNYTNSGNNKTLKIKFGAALATIFSTNVGATSYLPLFTIIQNANSTGSQTATPSAQTSSFQTSSGAPTTTNVDTTNTTTITITGTLANAGETISLQSYICKLFPSS